MSVWVGISPVIGAGSLEGFAVGAAVSGASFLAITAPRRLRRRRATAVDACGVPVSASSAEAGTLDAELCRVEAFGAGAETEPPAQPQPGAQRLAQPQPGAERVAQPQPGAERVAQPQPEAERVAQPQPHAQDDAAWSSPAGHDSRPAAYRSRHRLGDPVPGRAAPGGVSGRRARRRGAFLPGAFPSWASQDDAQPDTPFPDVASCDVAFPDGTFRSSRRPEARRLPRHAAPAVSFGAKVSGRVMGLFAARPLAGGAPG
jgi:hypothetical protein